MDVEIKWLSIVRWNAERKHLEGTSPHLIDSLHLRHKKAVCGRFRTTSEHFRIGGAICGWRRFEMFENVFRDGSRLRQLHPVNIQVQLLYSCFFSVRLNAPKGVSDAIWITLSSFVAPKGCFKCP